MLLLAQLQFRSVTPSCLRGSCMCGLSLSVQSFPVKISQDHLSFPGSGFRPVFAVTLLSLSSCPRPCPAPFWTSTPFSTVLEYTELSLKGIFQQFWGSVQLCQQPGECGGRGGEATAPLVNPNPRDGTDPPTAPAAGREGGRDTDPQGLCCQQLLAQEGQILEIKPS